MTDSYLAASARTLDLMDLIDSDRRKNRIMEVFLAVFDLEDDFGKGIFTSAEEEDALVIRRMRDKFREQKPAPHEKLVGKLELFEKPSIPDGLFAEWDRWYTQRLGAWRSGIDSILAGIHVTESDFGAGIFPPLQDPEVHPKVFYAVPHKIRSQGESPASAEYVNDLDYEFEPKPSG